MGGRYIATKKRTLKKWVAVILKSTDDAQSIKKPPRYLTLYSCKLKSIYPQPLKLRGCWLRFQPITSSIYAEELHSLSAGTQLQLLSVYVIGTHSPSFYHIHNFQS